MYRVVKFNERYREYLDYLDNHISGVIYAWEEILRPALEDSGDEEVLAALDLDKIGLQVYNHDRSKYTDDEFLGYCNHWYPQDGSEVVHDSKKPEADSAYNYAWSHHQHNNPHHSQYWLMVRDDGTVEALDMPLNYICEMLCDWASFHVNNPSEDRAIDWWHKNKKKFIMSDLTVDCIERLFDICPDL
jgi:hypothetical protein